MAALVALEADLIRIIDEPGASGVWETSPRRRKQAGPSQSARAPAAGRDPPGAGRPAHIVHHEKDRLAAGSLDALEVIII
jgi:hypothetical protein